MLEDCALRFRNDADTQGFYLAHPCGNLFEMIEDTLANIESRLKNSEGLSAEKRLELQELFARLKSEIGGLKSTHAEQAESIAGYAERSAHEATRGKKNPKLLNHSLSGLAASVEELEMSHPKLVQVVNGISRALSDVGI